EPRRRSRALRDSAAPCAGPARTRRAPPLHRLRAATSRLAAIDESVRWTWLGESVSTDDIAVRWPIPRRLLARAASTDAGQRGYKRVLPHPRPAPKVRGQRRRSPWRFRLRWRDDQCRQLCHAFACLGHGRHDSILLASGRDKLTTMAEVEEKRPRLQEALQQVVELLRRHESAHKAAHELEDHEAA